MEARLESTDYPPVEEDAGRGYSIHVEKCEMRGVGHNLDFLKGEDEEEPCRDVRLDRIPVRGCEMTRSDDVKGCGKDIDDDTGDDLRAILDLYQQALQDLRIFAHRRCLSKHFEGDQEMYSRLEARITSPDFVKKLEPHSEILTQTEDDHSSWDVINSADLVSVEIEDSWNHLDSENYVVVNPEDIIDGMACFMAKYVSSLPQVKEMSPKQLQAALKKAFNNQKKSKLQRLWSRSKLFYTAASWGATAMSLYNNPAVVEAASNAFWMSVQLVSKYI